MKEKIFELFFTNITLGDFFKCKNISKHFTFITFKCCVLMIGKVVTLVL